MTKEHTDTIVINEKSFDVRYETYGGELQKLISVDVFAKSDARLCYVDILPFLDALYNEVLFNAIEGLIIDNPYRYLNDSESKTFNDLRDE